MAFIRSELNDKIRNITLDDIQRRGVLVSPEEASRINTILNSVSHTVPFYNADALLDITNSSQLNSAFDLIWLDHSILIEDITILYNLYRGILEKTKERLVVPRLGVKEAISTTRNYLKLQAYESFYNLVQSFHMGSVNNEEQINTKLVIDKESGIMHLPIVREFRYSSDADMNISFDLITKGCKVIEQSDISFLFDSDLVWYINIVSEKLINEFPYESYDGVLLGIDINLPSVVNVNTIKVRLVSDVTEEIIDVLYSKNYSDTEADTRIDGFSVTNNGFVTDISFEPVFTRRLRVIIGSKLFREAERDTYIKNRIDPNYEEKVIKEVREIETDHLFLDRPIDIATARSRVTDAIFLDTIEIKKSRKIYSIPIRTIEVLYREYGAYGSFSTRGTVLEGNLAVITMEEEVVNSNGIKVVKKAIINGIDYSIGSLEEDGYVRDIVVVKIGDIDNRSKTYSFTTNFIPRNDNDIEIMAFGKVLDLSNVNFNITEQQQSGNKYYLSQSSEIVEGTTFTLRYLPALYDRAGVEYDPRKLDIIVSLGKPNTKNNLIANRVSKDIYFYATPTDISRYPINEVSLYKDTYRTPVDNAGAPFNGEPNSIGDVLWDGTSGYVQLSAKVYGPYRGAYLLIEEEKNVDNNGFLQEIGNPSVKGTTEPYVKGMIQVFQGTKPAVILSEYSARYGNVDEYKRITIDTNSIDMSKPVKVYYHPLPKYNGTFDNTTRNNMEKHNVSQNLVTSEQIKEITLERYPFIDPDVIGSTLFTKNRGTWFFKDRTSIIYEPIVIYVDRKKLELDKDYRLSGKKVSFFENITGNINIRYYVLADRVGFKIEMYREEPLKIGNTARLLSFLALGKVVK